MNRINLKFMNRKFRSIFMRQNNTMFLLTIVLLGVAGCAGLGHGGDPQQDLRQAAEKYWAARVAADWITCYKYSDVAKLQKESLSGYVRHQGNLIYKSAVVGAVEMKGDDEAIVHVAIEYYVPAFGTSEAFKTTLKNKWVRLDGKWYFHVEKGLMERMGKNEAREGGG